MTRDEILLTQSPDDNGDKDDRLAMESAERPAQGAGNVDLVGEGTQTTYFMRLHLARGCVGIRII